MRLKGTRGDDRQQADLFIYGTVEEHIPQDHPFRPVRGIADIALQALSPQFEQLDSAIARPSIAPEKLLRALLLQLLYHVATEYRHGLVVNVELTQAHGCAEIRSGLGDGDPRARRPAAGHLGSRQRL